MEVKKSLVALILGLVMISHVGPTVRAMPERHSAEPAALDLEVLAVLQTAPGVLADLPPRPTPRPIPQPSAKPRPPAGAWLELRAQFPSTWPWDSVHWQELWTVVQWQDPYTRYWHDVDGWRGGLDDVTVDEGGAVLGGKGWWVAEKDFGTGPFRWAIFQGQRGELLSVSEPFDLPDSTGATATIEVLLE